MAWMYFTIVKVGLSNSSLEYRRGITPSPDLGVLRFLGMLTTKAGRGSMSVQCVGGIVLILVAASAIIRLASWSRGRKRFGGIINEIGSDL